MDRRFELHEEQIRYVTQLPDRRLVVFTESTVNLFNGGGFKKIDVDEKNVIALDEYTPYQYKGYLTDGRLWVKNQNRLIVINIAAEKSQEDPLDYLKSLGFPAPPVNLFVDTYGDIWVLTKTEKLYRYDQREKKVSVFLETVTANGLKNDQLLDIARLNGLVYLFYRSGLMRCLDEATGKEVYQENFQKEGYADTRTRLWVNVVGPYLYLVRNDVGQGQLVRFDTRNRSAAVLLETKQYWLNNLTADKSGNFWISAKVGMWYFPSGADAGRYYPYLTLTDGRREDNEAYTLLYDQQGGLWVGTFNKGLYYYHPSRSRFLNIDKSFFEQGEGDDLRIYSVLSSAGKLWVGALDGLYRTDWKNGAPVGKFKKAMAGSEVRALYRSKSGTVWVGLSEGLYVLGNDGSLSRHLDIPVTYISETAEGSLWICTPNRGLYLYDPVAKKATLLFSAAVLNGVKQVISWNRYWAGVSAKGLFFIDKSDHSLHLSTDSTGIKNRSYPLIKDYFICIFSDDEGLLWIGSFGNLYVWDPAKKKLYQLGAGEGLVNQNIKGIIQDKDKTLWVTTSRGISNIQKVSADTGYHFIVQNYNRYDGVMDHTFSERAVYADTLQELFFGGVDGLNMLNRDIRVHTYETLSPVLSGFKLFGKPVSEGAADDGRIILEHAVASSDRIILRYNQNFFSIDFAGLNYINPSNTYFKYRLEGVDDDWRVERSASGTGEATYTRLAPGEYRFLLFASADGNRWSETPRSLLIVIEPPFWLTIYAKLIYAILLMAVGWYLYRHFKQRNEQKRQKQHKEAVEQAKAAFITNISHELRTPLTLITTPLKSLITRVTDTEVKNDLQRISNNSDLLLDNINQLLEFKKVDEAAEVLQLKYVTNLSFLKELFEVYAPLGKEKHIHFDAMVQDIDKEMWIDTSKVTRLVTNLLSNAFKFTPAGEHVVAEAGLNAEMDLLIIKVKDTGVGISKEDQARIFDRFYQSANQIDGNTGSGIGLFMAKQYAEMHGGTIAVSGRRGEGSLFEVRLPVDERKPGAGDSESKDEQKKTILVVEDHDGLREFVKRELDGSYNVLTANNGVVGLEMALQQHPDLIITDRMMPEMNGDELSKRVRGDISVSHIPIIMLTARTSDQARFEGYESGVDAYLVKPFDMELLRLRIRKLMQLAEARRRSFGTEREIKVAAITTNTLDKELLERALQCVNGNLDNPDYSVEKFSSDMLMDRTGLYRKLMALTGQSPTNFVRTIRLNRAAELLLEKQLPVSEIAAEVGFNSVSYFSKCFHEKFGKTPSQYGE
ncbi:hybrid sensor histidine kinase/response regulator transcription factor [Niabella beijingensis]|uniref:hybrid sensor histidine kinase/response regulator transcription factor n=1 Tax=Niabella beijingensis TaxID=2872700 RepID=UPI001CC1B1BE|nr:ATP-binding protein [Niabella beijingensis]MBZ4191987.1 response regulator [Niabella beijingensis]